MGISTDFANIGFAQRRRRRVAGACSLAVALAIVATSWLLGWGTLARLASAPLFFAGFLGIFQARDRTCVALAARGECNLGTGPQRIEDAEQMQQARAKAARVLLKSLSAASASTLIALLLP